jgi:hypothetical protein
MIRDDKKIRNRDKTSMIDHTLSHTIDLGCAPCNPLKFKARLWLLLALCWSLYLAYTSALKIEAICSETSIHSQWTIWAYISEGRNIHKHRCENLF